MHEVSDSFSGVGDIADVPIKHVIHPAGTDAKSLELYAHQHLCNPGDPERQILHQFRPSVHGKKIKQKRTIHLRSSISRTTPHRVPLVILPTPRAGLEAGFSGKVSCQG